MDKIDYKKSEKELYFPKQEPSIIKIPKMGFIMVDGTGNPNKENGEYQKALELLYGLSYTIKMSKMGKETPEGYFDYVVPPLEGLWDIQDEYFDGTQIANKDHFIWTSMIRQPEFVTPEIFEWAVASLKQKKPDLDYTKARFEVLEEGRCVQAMHIGSYDTESNTIQKIEQFIVGQGYQNDIGSHYSTGQKKRHHEIYLSDPRKTKPENLKTVIRHPINN